LIDINYQPTANYNSIQTANEKIADYGPILKDAEWQGTESIMDSYGGPIDFPSGGQHFTSMRVVHDNPDSSPYFGYVQCGYFQKGGDYYYMMVNRRTEKFVASTPPLDKPITTPSSDYTTVYFPMTLQRVMLTKLANGTLGNIFGPYQGLYDPFTNDLQPFGNAVAEIAIEPGEATLRQLVATLPSNVTSDYTSVRDVYVQGVINIQDGVVVNLGTHKVILLENCCINVWRGATLLISGILDAKSLSQIHVFDGGSLIFQEANCFMGESSSIYVGENSSINISRTEFDANDGGIWEGISSSRGQITFSGSTIKNASTGFHLDESSFEMSDSKIYVPLNGIGILSTDIGVGNEINLTATNNETNLITSSSGTQNGAKGIVMNSKTNPFYCSGTVFQNLDVGIEYSLTAVKADSVTDCEFNNCITGINVTGSSGLAKIRNCQFNYENQNPSIYCFGIKLQTYNPLIHGCSFWSNSLRDKITGIFLDATQTIKEKPISNCTFENLGYGIQGRESQIKITENVFINNIRGVAIGAKSLFCFNDGARNEFKSIYSNLWFWDSRYSSNGTEKFIASVYLRAGHNDFYNFTSCIDFRFDQNQYDFTNSSRIDATGNFWGYPDDDDATPTVIPSQYVDLVQCDYSDRGPNIPDPNITNNRLDTAAGYEKIEAYSSAYLLYQQILHERLPEEKDYWDLCVPKIFSLAKGNQFDFDALLSYYDTEIVQTNPEDKIEMIWLMNTYKAFTCLEKKDYQGAADIISERITNPISEIDSLNAVIDLEIVYFQRELDGAKKPLSTNYTQYNYPNLQTFNMKHTDNLNKLQALYDRQNESPNSIPANVLLNRNYPNPFNPSTTIEFGIPIAEKVSIKIYNIRGQVVKELVNHDYGPGKYNVVWEGKNDSGTSVSSGVYFYRLEAGSKCITHKMLLLK
jgi:hypothetical protein